METTANRVPNAHNAPETQHRPQTPIIDADAIQAASVEQEVF